MMIRQPVSSRVMLTDRRFPFSSVELELELALDDDPRLLARAVTELCAEAPDRLRLRAAPWAELPLDRAVAAPPASATQLFSTLPSAL